MKTLRLIYACMMMSVCMAFAACSDDDDVNVSNEKLVGTWSVIEDAYNFKEDGKVVDSGTDRYNEGEWTFTLNADGTCAVMEDGYTDHGNWSAKGNKITFTIYDESVTITVVEFSSSKMVIEYRDSYTEDGIKYDDYEKMTLKKS